MAPKLCTKRRSREARDLIARLYGLDPAAVRVEQQTHGIAFYWGPAREERQALQRSRAGRGLSAARREADEVFEVQRELLLHLGIRAHVLAGKDLLRNEIPRDVAYSDVQALWSEVGSSVPLREFGGGLVGCYLDLAARVRQILEVADRERLVLYPHEGGAEGEYDLLVRVGADGTRRWWRTIEVICLCVEDGHQAESWEPIAVALASEKHEVLRRMTEECGLRAATETGLWVDWAGTRVWCRFVLCGDHMLQVA